MYDVIYFNAWSDIICTAAKLLHGTSALKQKPLFKNLLCIFLFFLQTFYRTGKDDTLI